MNSSKYKSIFILSLIIIITSIIGEFSRFEIKEGFDIGDLFSGIKKMFTFIPDTFNIVTGIFKKIFSIFELIFTKIPVFLGKILIWAFVEVPWWMIQYVICAWYKLLALPDCFLWYMLEIIGKIIYLPFRLTFWILDVIISRSGIEDINIQGSVDKLWWFIDDIDHFQYPLTNFHIVHYPDDIIQKCYRCTVGNFPKFPKW
jgi:hypothetical protein